jgi:hypothetical protein
VSSLATWHHRLGHINYTSFIHLTRKGLASGMAVNLSMLPMKCDHYILGKQGRNTVPSIQEGRRATRHLEKVFINLTGPFITSPTGFSYVMNIVDNYSSFIWSIPLCDKTCAFLTLSAWQCLHEAETSLSFGVFCTDHGELHSNQMEAWLSTHGTKHEFTAPYTSAQNGQAKHTHLTIQNLV